MNYNIFHLLLFLYLKVILFDIYKIKLEQVFSKKKKKSSSLVLNVCNNLIYLTYLKQFKNQYNIQFHCYRKVYFEVLAITM